MDSCGDMIVHLVTLILPNFSEIQACANSVGKPISPLITHFPPISFLHEDCFPTASCNVECCVGEIYSPYGVTAGERVPSGCDLSQGLNVDSPPLNTCITDAGSS
jgi:hypothetical protein